MVGRILELMNFRDTKGFLDLLHNDHDMKVCRTIRSEFTVSNKTLKEKYFGNDGGSALYHILYSDASKLLVLMRLK